MISGQPVVMVKGTNCAGKSTLIFELRKAGWFEKIVDRRKKDGVCYTKFTRYKRTNKSSLCPIFVVGRYGPKGGGCDGLSKDECLKTLNYLWDKRGAIYFEGQNIADTLTTHPMWMMSLNRVDIFSFTSRGTVPEIIGMKPVKRKITVVCLDVPLERIFKRLKRRTPGKVLKNDGAKTKSKHASVIRQYGEMKKWIESRNGNINVEKYRNTKGIKKWVMHLHNLLGMTKRSSKKKSVS